MGSVALTECDALKAGRLTVANKTAQHTLPKKKFEELEENSYHYHRLISRHLNISGATETQYEDACKEIGRLQGFEQGVKIAVELKE